MEEKTDAGLRFMTRPGTFMTLWFMMLNTPNSSLALTLMINVKRLIYFTLAYIVWMFTLLLEQETV